MPQAPPQRAAPAPGTCPGGPAALLAGRPTPPPWVVRGLRPAPPPDRRPLSQTRAAPQAHSRPPDVVNPPRLARTGASIGPPCRAARGPARTTPGPAGRAGAMTAVADRSPPTTCLAHGRGGGARPAGAGPPRPAAPPAPRTPARRPAPP